MIVSSEGSNRRSSLSDPLRSSYGSPTVRQDADAMTASLRDAMSETDDVLKDVTMQLSRDFDKGYVQKSDTDDNREPSVSVSDDELLQRVSALEHEVKALREELLLRRIS